MWYYFDRSIVSLFVIFFVIPPYDSTQYMRQLYQLCHPLLMLGLSLPVSRIYSYVQTLVQTTAYSLDAVLLWLVTSHSDQPTHCLCASWLCSAAQYVWRHKSHWNNLSELLLSSAVFQLYLQIFCMYFCLSWAFQVAMIEQEPVSSLFKQKATLHYCTM